VTVRLGRRPRRIVTVPALNPLSANDLLSSFGTLGVLVVLFAGYGLGRPSPPSTPICSP
jgi:hypothetical protein